MKYILVYIVILLFLYITCGFIVGSMKIETWPMDGRLGIVLSSAFVTVALFLFNIVE
jgi:hypothetical protein